MATSFAAQQPAGTLARWYSSFGAVLERAQSIAALAMRLYVAKVFFVSGLLKFQRWDSTLALFENEYHVPLLSPATAAFVGTGMELGLPVLLALGLGTRAAALALFVFNIIAVISYPDLSPAGMKDHVLWGTLLAIVAIYGPGRVSADRWLGVH